MIPLFLLLAAAPDFDRAQAEKDFRSANERALEGDLQGAIGLYRTLIERGVKDADVHYNLGNAYAESGRPIEAIVAYERALRLAPHDEEIRTNLTFVRSKVNNAKEGEALTLADAIEPVIGPLDPVLFGFVAGGANLLLFFFLFLRRRSVRRAMAGAIFAAILLVVSTAVVAGHLVLARDPRAVMVEAGSLLEGPHSRFKVKGPRLHGGRVRILDEVEGYVEVLQQDGTTGWVPRNAVRKI